MDDLVAAAWAYPLECHVWRRHIVGGAKVSSQARAGAGRLRCPLPRLITARRGAVCLPRG